MNLFKHSEFANFRINLDAEMKRLKKSSLGSKKRQAEPLSIKEENLLWEKGLLGSKDPQTLVDTMLFMNGLYFVLRSGLEHRQLRFNPCQIQLYERHGEKPYLEYTKDVSKNKPGGLKNRKTKPKVVVNEENPERCFVRLFNLYTSLCPQQSPKNSFYLQPRKKPQPNCWYSTKPVVGHNTLEGTVARLCKNAGMLAFKITTPITHFVQPQRRAFFKQELTSS